MNFIGEYMLDDLSICDEIIDFYSTSNKKQLGATSKGVDIAVKNSTDVMVNWQTDEIAQKYVDSLAGLTNKYIEEYNFCNVYSAWSITEPINIQHYDPNGGFYKWHTERASSDMPVASRHLAFMTYLNDVNDAGETEFYYQKLKVKPKKGLTLIWPADWTHTHRGVPSPTEEKYIITGWFNFRA